MDSEYAFPEERCKENKCIRKSQWKYKAHRNRSKVGNESSKSCQKYCIGIFKKMSSPDYKSFLNLFVKDIVRPNRPLQRVIDFT